MNTFVDELMRRVNENEGLWAFIALMLTSIGLLVRRKIFNRKSTARTHVNSPHVVVGRDIRAGRDIKIGNFDTHQLRPKAKLRLVLENQQADNRSIVLENPDRGFSPGQLYVVIYNDNKNADAEKVEVRLKWPPEGFSTFGLWDPTGNKDYLWESIGTEKVYSRKVRVYAGDKRVVGLMGINRFDGDIGKIKYKLLAKNLQPVIGEVVIRKEMNPEYLGL